MGKDTLKAMQAFRGRIIAEYKTDTLTIRLPIIAKNFIQSNEFHSKLRDYAVLLWLTSDKYTPQLYEGDFDRVCEQVTDIQAIAVDFVTAWAEDSLVDVFDYEVEI